MKNTNISEYKSLSSIVDEKDVLSFNIINNKKQLFIKISNLLIHNTEFSSSQLSQVLLKNESDKPTNIGSGVAIPNIQDKNINIMCRFTVISGYMFFYEHLFSLIEIVSK